MTLSHNRLFSLKCTYNIIYIQINFELQLIMVHKISDNCVTIELNILPLLIAEIKPDRVIKYHIQPMKIFIM